MRIGIRKIGMRIGEPGGLDQLHGAAHLMRLALEFCREHRGRHQRRRELDRLHHALARDVAVHGFQFQRAGGEQHAALAAIGLLVDQARGQIRIEDRERAAPVAARAAEAEHRMRGPGRGRRQLDRFLRDHHGADRIVGALRLDEQAAQAEQRGYPRARPWRGRRAAPRRDCLRAAPIAHAGAARADRSRPAAARYRRDDGQARCRHGRSRAGRG